jgi:hypothetical protein
MKTRKLTAAIFDVDGVPVQGPAARGGSLLRLDASPSWLFDIKRLLQGSGDH